MCTPASFVITRNGKVFWSRNSDSHEKIIREYKLNEGSGALVGEANFVRVEVTPPKNDMLKPLSEWRYNLDESNPPSWYDAAIVEGAARVHLPEWYAAKVIVDGMEIAKIESGEWYICGGTIGEVWGGTISAVRGGTISEVCGGTISEVYGGTISAVRGGTISEVRGGTIGEVWGGTIRKVYGGTISEVRGGTISKVYGGTISEVWGGTISAVRGGTISKVYGGTISAVRGGTISAVYCGTISEVYGGTIRKVYGGTISTYIKINKSILKGTTAVLVDRSGAAVKCYVGKAKKERTTK